MIAQSLQALLTSVLDYAGLFPPAKLSMDRALADYLRHRAGPDGWMLGNFVCSAARLGDLAAFSKQIASSAEPIRISALGRGGASGAEFMAGLDADLGDISACCEKHAGKVVVPALETKLPVELLSYEHRLRDLLAATAEATVISRMALFFEAPPDDADCLDGLLSAIQETPFAALAGYKLRMGGLEASAFPSSSRVALALAQCLRAGVPMKATAGLHHPLPRLDETTGAQMHGFVNLFLAGILGQVHPLAPTTLQEILDEEDPQQFSFSDDRLAWRDLSASAEQVGKARTTAVLSFGCCSFDEPRDDLRALGWLEPPEQSR
jgi:hypothetical protein